MASDIHLRLANIKDANCLLKWRNDPQTRQASHSTELVEVADHMAWLKASLCNKQRRLYIAELAEQQSGSLERGSLERGSLENAPVGTIRADLEEGAWLLSWTVAPDHRGKGVAKRILSLAIDEFTEPLLAQIKCANIASVKVAERAGFRLDKEENGVLFYRFDR